MLRYFRTPETGNPSPLLQHFPPIDITVLCCHFWWLKDWHHASLAFPYWRLYWNPVSGAHVILGDESYALGPDCIVLIPPNTPFSTRLETEATSSGISRDHLLGGPAPGLERLDLKLQPEVVYHFFIHFTAGLPYDEIQPQVFRFPIDEHSQGLLIDLLTEWDDNAIGLSHRQGFVLTTLISSFLGRIPEAAWPSVPDDARVRRAIKIIEDDLSLPHTNQELAQAASMSPNAFARLFKQHTGWSPQNYLMKRRIQKACVLLHHTGKTIEEIADECGFCNRHYLSRVFKREVSVSPAAYREQRHPV